MWPTLCPASYPLSTARGPEAGLGLRSASLTSGVDVRGLPRAPAAPGAMASSLSVPHVGRQSLSSRDPEPSFPYWFRPVFLESTRFAYWAFVPDPSSAREGRWLSRLSTGRSPPAPRCRLSCHRPRRLGGQGRGLRTHRSGLAGCPSATWTARGGLAAHGHGAMLASAQKRGPAVEAQGAGPRVRGGRTRSDRRGSLPVRGGHSRSPARQALSRRFGAGDRLYPRSHSVPPAPSGGREG